MQFLVVDRCRNHLANLLSSWTSQKIWNLALKFRRYLSQFHRCNYFRFWRPYRYVRLSVAVVYTLAETIFHLYVVIYPRFVVGILTVLFTVSEIQVFPVSAAFPTVGHYWNHLGTLPASLPWSNVVGFVVRILMVCDSFGDISTSGYLAAISDFRHDVASAMIAGHLWPPPF